MAARGPRRRRRPRWLALAALLSLIVLAINAAVSARSREPERRLAELAYLDQARPHIQNSTEQGAELSDTRDHAAQLGRVAIARRLDRVQREADAAARAVRRLDPPPRLLTAHSLLVATLVIRAKAARAVRDGLVSALGTDPPAPTVDRLVGAGDDLAAGDRTYKIFVASLPKIASATAPVPASTWIANATIWTRPEVAVFVASLRASTALAPVHDVALVVANTDPPAVGTENGASVLPPLKTLRLEIVVANVGNEAERHVTVVATVTGPGGEIDTARDFVDLAPGQRRALTLGGLRPPGGPSTLSVRIEPVAGEANSADNERVTPIVVR